MTEVDPKFVKLDTAGLVRSRWLARLPQGAIADNLKTPAIWARMQGTRTPLRRWDELLAIGFDESFAVECVVVDATSTGATVEIVKILKGVSREVPLFNDGTFAVRWEGDGFNVYRLADDKKIDGPFGSEALAIRHLRQAYPQQVA